MPHQQIENIDTPSLVSVPEIDIMWDVIRPLVKSALKYTPYSNAGDVKQRLFNHLAQLWQKNDYESILITEVVIYPRAKVLNLWLMAGRNPDNEDLKIIENWGKESSCTHMEFTGRKGWERKVRDFDKLTLFRKRL